MTPCARQSPRSANGSTPEPLTLHALSQSLTVQPVNRSPSSPSLSMVLLSPSYASHSSVLAPAHYAAHHIAHHAPAVLASSQSSPPVLPACACQSGNRTAQGTPQPARQPLAAAERAALLRRRRAVIAARFAALANGRQRASSRPAAGTVTDENGQPVALFHPSPRGCSLLGRGVESDPILAPSERRALRVDVEIARDAELWAIGRASPCYWLTLPAVPTLAPRGGCGC